MNDKAPAPSGEAEDGGSSAMTDAARSSLRDHWRIVGRPSAALGSYRRRMTAWRTAAAMALTALLLAPPAGASGQPVPIPEVVAETPVSRPPIPAPALTVGTSSVRGAPAAVSAAEPPVALDRTG